MQETINCPNCGKEIQLSTAIVQEVEKGIKAKYIQEYGDKLNHEKTKLTEQVRKEFEEAGAVEKKDLEEQLKEKTQQVKKMQAEEISFRKRERELADKERSADLDIEARLEKEREKIRSEALKEASAKDKREIKSMQDQLVETQKELEDAQKTELGFRAKQRELEKERQKLELEVARKVDEERSKIREETLQIAAKERELKDAEKEKQFEAMRKQIDELKRKAEQGSQKIQGQVLEMALEDMLSQDSPFDVIEPVSPGVKGGDILQTINTQSGRYCGKILWETKRTKAWSDKWIQKVKDDQRDAKADIAVIVSETLPSGFHHFRQIDGVWVADIPSACSLALALRVVLIKAANERMVQAGKEGKMEIVYNYLTGPEFKNRVEAIVEGFIGMKGDLEREKAATQRQWAKREKNIERVIANTVGLHGDLEGIAGASLPAIKMLKLPSNEEIADTQK
ncbi:MAG: DUF2130 domain-containing protein [Candidatus Omnitrophota bacterium]